MTTTALPSTRSHVATDAPPARGHLGLIVFGAFAGGIVVGLVEATTALVLPPSLKSVGIYAVYLLVVFIRPRGLFGSM